MTDSTQKTSWATWLGGSDKSPVYLMINPLSVPNPVNTLYVNNWVEQAFPLYSGTSLAHLMEQGPWLIQPKMDCLSTFARLLDHRAFSDGSWGWAYRSDTGWQAHPLVFQAMETQMALGAAVGTASNNDGSWETESAPPLISEKEKLFMAAIVSSTPTDRAQLAWGL
ncbi:DUF4123 domain-containing protein [Xenorhabdus ishibashii]|uniref:DUF4123 domain-containing protein n=1 Tax=Xenorhabdus ishibashii TaxID=1034471 RepID=A0A2D0KHE4_9GAMM|nr:DUF4123 domain-containing protein [Xenorhabdus ishibashii]PHM62637.1 hypothetical protein Xish_01847 [Xenorhabdus ishibashii]